MFTQIFWLNRDNGFNIYLKNADGSDYVIPGAAEYRLRIYGKPGLVLVDLPWNAGISLGNALGGRLDVQGGLLDGITEEYYQASADLTRTDTGADVIAVWPAHVILDGTVPWEPQGGVVINTASQQVAVSTLSGFGGADGPQGPAGASTLVSGIVPLFANGNFRLWDKGTGPFNATGVICNGVRFQKGAGTTHAVERALGFNDPFGEYCLRWDRSVVGTGTSFMKFFVPDLSRFHGKTVTWAFEAKAGASLAFTARLSLNYGTGGSVLTTQNSTNHTASATVQTFTKAAMAIDLTGKTVTDDSSLEFQILRTATQDDGTLDIQRMRMFIGGTDYGAIPFDRALQREQASRYLETIDTATINGSQRVYFGKKRVVPAITASLGTVSDIKVDSCLLTHTAVGASTLTIDAELAST